MKQSEQIRWYDEGYKKGIQFAVAEADYDELAAIARSRAIPANWDIFRAEILNTYLADPSFDFKLYLNGFARACIQYFEQI
jgi:hypothetical protein